MRKVSFLLLALFLFSLVIFPSYAYWKDSKVVLYRGHTGTCKIWVTPIVIRENNLYPGFKKEYRILICNVGTTTVKLRAILENVPSFLKVDTYFLKDYLRPRESTFLIVRVLMPEFIENYQNYYFTFRIIVEARQVW